MHQHRKAFTFTAAALVGFGGTLAAAPDAHAATTKPRAIRALEVAKTKKGAPYKYGAAGPSRFDCSGLVMWSYGKVGKKLPRVAQDQYNHSKHVSPSNRKVGDLVFFGNNSRDIYHAGFYAGFWDGHGWVYAAPRTGQTVGYRKISDLAAGRPRAFYGKY